MHWIPLSLLSAFVLALADAVTKRWLPNLAARDITVIRFGLGGLLTLPLMIMNPPSLPDPAFWGWMLWLIPAELLAFILYMQAIRDYPLWLTLPYMAFTPVFITVVGWAILDEVVSLAGLAGILMVVAGSWLLHFNHPSLKGLRDAMVAPFYHPGSRKMLTVALIYSLTAVGGKGALQYMPPSQFGPLYVVVVGLGALIVFNGWERVPRVLDSHRWPAIAAAVLMAAMVVTHFLALNQIETAYMIAVKRVSLLFGILFGFLWFRETGFGRKLVAGMVIVAGVAVIATQG